MLYESIERYSYWEFDLIFFISKSGCKYSYTNSYIFAITLVTQDDHLTAGAWAAPDMKRKNTRR